MTKKFKMAFRLRSLFCKKCHLTTEYFGYDPILGVCECCKTPLSELPVVSDNWIETEKCVTPWSKRNEQPSVS